MQGLGRGERGRPHSAPISRCTIESSASLTSVWPSAASRPPRAPPTGRRTARSRRHDHGGQPEHAEHDHLRCPDLSAAPIAVPMNPPSGDRGDHLAERDLVGHRPEVHGAQDEGQEEDHEARERAQGEFAPIASPTTGPTAGEELPASRLRGLRSGLVPPGPTSLRSAGHAQLAAGFAPLPAGSCRLPRPLRRRAVTRSTASTCSDSGGLVHPARQPEPQHHRGQVQQRADPQHPGRHRWPCPPPSSVDRPAARPERRPWRRSATPATHLAFAVTSVISAGSSRGVTAPW